MAIDEGSESVTLAKKDRTRSIEIFVADDDTVQLRFHRERVFMVGSVIKHREPISRVVARSQAQIATKSYTAAGKTGTGNQILALINKMSDEERQVDIDNPPPIGS